MSETDDEGLRIAKDIAFGRIFGHKRFENILQKVCTLPYPDSRSRLWPWFLMHSVLTQWEIDKAKIKYPKHNFINPSCADCR